MFKAKIILFITEIGLLTFLHACGFIAHCIENHNYILLVLPLILVAALIIGIDKLISFFRKRH